MPYELRRKGNRYQVVNKSTGHVFSTTSKAKAERQLRLLRSIEHGWDDEGDGTFTRRVNGRQQRMRVTGGS